MLKEANRSEIDSNCLHSSYARESSMLKDELISLQKKYVAELSAQHEKAEQEKRESSEEISRIKTQNIRLRSKAFELERDLNTTKRDHIQKINAMEQKLSRANEGMRAKK